MGTFYCTEETECAYEKYTDNILTTTKCLANAKWEKEDKYSCKPPNYDIIIENPIISGDTWAVGYHGNFYTGTVRSIGFNRLGWKLGDQFVEYSVNQDGTCTKINDQTINVGFDVTCNNIENKVISYLSLKNELDTSSSITFSSYEGISCGYKTKNKNFQVKR